LLSIEDNPINYNLKPNREELKKLKNRGVIIFK